MFARKGAVLSALAVATKIRSYEIINLISCPKQYICKSNVKKKKVEIANLSIIGLSRLMSHTTRGAYRASSLTKIYHMIGAPA
jgi:hypothetical protein